MIPDSESICQTSEAAVRSTDVYHKIKNTPEGEAASVTAWKRYQQLVAIVESRGGKFNRKSMIEAIFRGNDLVYASHWFQDQYRRSTLQWIFTKASGFIFIQWRGIICKDTICCLVIFNYTISIIALRIIKRSWQFSKHSIECMQCTKDLSKIWNIIIYNF